MHNLILKLFEISRQIVYFVRIISIFLITTLSLYWAQNLIGTSWGWIKPLNGIHNFILDFSSLICSAEWKIHTVLIEVKYIIGIILLIALTYVLKVCFNWLDDLRDAYKNVHIDCKKINEKIVNKQLHQERKNEELQITNYSVLINTKVAAKYSHPGLNTDVDDQNKQMNDFINKKLNVQYTNFKGGFLYSFNDFSNIDNILDVLFKVIKGQSRLDYAICIQVNNDLKQLSKLSDLNYYGKIIMAAETSYRYRFNSFHRYETVQIGVYQNEEGTYEVHEFRQML